MSYHLLGEAARKRTEHFVIESAVDTENVIKAEIPPELLTLLQQSLAFDDDFAEDGDHIPMHPLDGSHGDVLGYLLAWMITFDLFMNAVRLWCLLVSPW